MASLSDMYDRIQDEMQRDDLAAQTVNAVTQAVAYYQRNAFYLSDKTSTATTVSGTQSYAFPTDLAWFHDPGVFITVSGTRYPLRNVDHSGLLAEDAAQSTTTKGSPEDYSIFGLNIFLFPTPNASTYTILYDYVQMIPQPTDPTDSTSFWVTDAEAVIRNRAKAILYGGVTHEFQLAQVYAGMAEEEHQQLEEVTAMRKWGGGIKPWYG